MNNSNLRRSRRQERSDVHCTRLRAASVIGRIELSSPLVLLTLSRFPTSKGNGFISFCVLFSRVNKTIVKMKQFRLHTYSLQVVASSMLCDCQCLPESTTCSATIEWLETFSLAADWLCVALNCRASAHCHCICKFACLFMNKSPIGLIGVIYLFGLRIRTGQNAGNATIWHSSTPEAMPCNVNTNALWVFGFKAWLTQMQLRWHSEKRFNSFPSKLNKLYSISALISFYSCGKKKRIRNLHWL